MTPIPICIASGLQLVGFKPMSALKMLIFGATSADASSLPPMLIMAARMLMATNVRGQPAFTQEALDELFGA